MFLLWLIQLPQCGDWTPASVPALAEGRSSPTNTPVFPPTSFILQFCMVACILFCWSGTPIHCQLTFSLLHFLLDNPWGKLIHIFLNRFSTCFISFWNSLIELLHSPTWVKNIVSILLKKTIHGTGRSKQYNTTNSKTIYSLLPIFWAHGHGLKELQDRAAR